MIDTKVNWKVTEKGVEGTFRIQKEEIEFTSFIDRAANGSFGILIDMYFDLFDMEKLSCELNKLNIYEGYLFCQKSPNSGDFLFEYLSEDHKLREVFGEGIIHIGGAGSIRDAQIYSEIVIDQVRKYLHV